MRRQGAEDGAPVALGGISAGRWDAGVVGMTVPPADTKVKRWEV